MIISIFSPDTENRQEPIAVSARPVYTPELLSGWAMDAFTEIGLLQITEDLKAIQDMPESALSRLLWRIGMISGKESSAAVRARTDAFAKALLSTGTDCVVVAPSETLGFLLRALEKRGCSIRRSHFGAVRPGEHIRVTEKAAHCGGCQHNCLLSNPGCGVGEDKAQRGY